MTSTIQQAAVQLLTSVSITMSQDISAAPQDILFQSGDIELTDTTSYLQVTAYNMTIPANTADMALTFPNLAAGTGMACIQFLQPLSIQAGIPNPTVAPPQIKLVPFGGNASSCPWLTAQFNQPIVLPLSLGEIHIQNADTAQPINAIVGVAGA